MTTTADMGLPEVASQQVQPEVTHNEALQVLSAMLNGVIDTGRNTAPGSPTVGDAYIIGTSPTGTWAGHANAVTVYTAGGWRYLPGKDNAGTVIAMGARQKGMHVWVRDDGASPAGGALYLWKGAAWVEVPGTRVAD